VRDRLVALGCVLGRDLGYREDVGGTHDEGAWARRLADALRFLFGPARGAPPPPAGLALEPFQESLPLTGKGTELALQADVGGVRMTLPNVGTRFASLDPDVVGVHADGHVTPRRVGAARLVAVRGGLRAESAVEVVEEVFVRFQVPLPDGLPPDAAAP